MIKLQDGFFVMLMFWRRWR